MTIGNPQRSVLVIGASQRVLDDCVAALRDLGYTAQGTNDFFSDITGRFDVTNIDLVSLGHLIPPDRDGRLSARPELDRSGPPIHSKRSWKTAYLALLGLTLIGYNIRIGEFLVMIIRREGRYGRAFGRGRPFPR
jgi:hypothetical protein